jgi:hypothetical protein
MAGVLILEMDG